MTTSLPESAQAVHEAFSRSEALRRLGYATSSRELTNETVALDAGCRFTLQPNSDRELVIHFYYRRDGHHYFTVEVANTELAASFLLDEWMTLHGLTLTPYPFTLRSYTGTQNERLAGFVSFLGDALSIGALARVLDGASWVDVAFDWGELR